MRTILILSLTTFSLQYGCASTSDAPNRPSGTEPIATVVDARPAALIDGHGVSWGELRPILSELAGADALREVILDRALDQTASRAGILITPNDLEAERSLLNKTLSDDPNRAIRLLDELRALQGLGPTRFNALMHRNATLRALVRDRVEVSDSAVRRMHDVLYGPKRQGRLMMLPTLAVANRAIERVDEGDFFGEVAAQLSTDASASRGGILEPFSRNDSSYPEALRSALWSLEVGELSQPILLEDQYAVLMLVREIQAEDVPLEEIRADLEQRVRRKQERLLMDQVAREMMQGVNITIFDDSLNASWQQGRRSRR